ncbi:MAG: hypothetical protein CVU57_00900 [Deltaproteobacteria bacterium HGW-Deltaproteobacteria-15]|nr:MAG: hypothetical protein CVU57_00900 [Deltaproteobacteria bacterium HGW-Deltaproteobacteria-15]
MALLRSLAHWLARTEFGRKSLNKPVGQFAVKWQPGTRVYIGLVLVVISLLLGLPALALLGYLSARLSKPMMMAVGGPIVVLLVHVMFGIGVYLAGRNYLVEMLHWAAKRFLQKYRE